MGKTKTNFPNIPDDLRKIPHWVVYRELSGVKVPFRSKEPNVPAFKKDENGRVDRTRSWSTFEDSVAACLDPKNNLTGIGWDIFPPYVGADWDKKDVKPETLELIKSFASYAEVSPSGEGYHLILRGAAPADPKDTNIAPKSWNVPAGVGNFEIYSRDRWFTVTGNQVEGTLSEVRDCDKSVIATLYMHAGAKVKQNKNRGPRSKKIEDGARNQTLASIAGLLWSQGVGEDVLRQSAHSINQEKIEPPLPHDEVEKIVRSICGYEEGSIETQVDFTDGALLERWSREAAPTVRYLTDDKSWFVYRDGIWQEHSVGPVYEIREFLKLQEPASGSLDEKAQDRLHHRLNSQKLVAAVKSLAPGQPELQHEAREFDPDPMLIGLPDNKVLDLRTGDVRDVSPADLITRRLPVAPAIEESAEWLAFLDETHPNQPEIVGFLKRWFGYCLTADVREDKILFFLGVGGAGKGTTIEPFSALLGPYFLSIPIAMLLEDTGEDRRLNYIAALRGVRLAVCNEGSKMRKLDSRGIKALTGGGEITGRRLCHQPTTFVQTHKIIVLANDSPVLDLDDAMMQRVLLVPFEVQFRGTDKCKPELRDFFRSPQQLSGILRWMVNGCLEWQRSGLRPPQEVRNASAKYFKESDYFQQFLDDHVELDAFGFVGTENLYQRWCRYCETNGLWTSKGTSKTFVTDLKARCPHVESGVRVNGLRGLKGLKLKETKESF